MEAPLTGGLQLLKIGQMTILAGGPQDLIKYCTPLMRSYTDEKRILRMGDYGAASVVKIITNMLAGAHQVSQKLTIQKNMDGPSRMVQRNSNVCGA